MHPILHERRRLIPFRTGLLPQIFTDTLVIGSGVGGLRAAIGAAAHGEVILVTKADAPTSNTAWAQGGIAAALARGDSAEAHALDTIATGAGLCDEEVVRTVVGQGAERMREVLRWGMRLDTDADGEPVMGLEGGHSAARIVHADGDATGRELVRCLIDRVRRNERVRLFERCFALDLLMPTESPGSPCMGAITHHPRYGLQVIWAKATILASGGSGVLWRETTNPRVATADGLAMAFRAGASLSDMAFMQFHPTTLYLAGSSRALISEAVRGEGAHLVDRSGRRFMLDQHERGELAPRDVVSRAIVKQVARDGGSHVWLDARHVAGFSERFPSITQTLEDFGLDPASDLIPVQPAAHYMVGGVRTDACGRTDVPGLYAVGEAACSGLHGANRLASNSLLEGLVFGAIAGEAAQEMTGAGPGGTGANNGWGVSPARAPVTINSDIPPSDRGELDLADVLSSLRSAMWRNVGVERTGAKLRDAAEMVAFWARYSLDKVFDDPAGWETQNMLLVGALVARAALWREESRGCHARTDFPDPDDRFRAHDVWNRASDAPTLIGVDGAGAQAVAAV